MKDPNKEQSNWWNSGPPDRSRNSAAIGLNSRVDYGATSLEQNKQRRRLVEQASGSTANLTMQIIAILLVTSSSMWLSACASFGPKQNVTFEGRGARLYDDSGEPILNSGRYYKQVTEGFADGYSAGLSEQRRREYWNKQVGQGANQARSVGLYDAALPSEVDVARGRQTESNLVPIVQQNER
jgi:hypothetical protein